LDEDQTTQDQVKGGGMQERALRGAVAVVGGEGQNLKPG
jgi:hypothetical protein